MATFSLLIIYLTFISLGLPDSLLGSAWPVMHVDLAVPLPHAGLISMIISGGTILSSLFSARLINCLGTGKVTCISVTMTAFALFGFSASSSFLWLCLLSVPFGLGAGAVDAALNNFVALHYKARHMSWLHCFWGVGATLGPIIMSVFMSANSGWQKGYLQISTIQFCLAFLLLVTLPIWKKYDDSNSKPDPKSENNKDISNPFKIAGAKVVLLSFFFYCATEATAGLWGSSYLVTYKGVAADAAARWISLFYAGITVGRFISGFATIKFKNHILIRAGQIICMIGAVILLLPLPPFFSMIGLSLIGFGCAPIYPCMLHETPNRFGETASQAIMGFQMAFAYMGSTFMPPIFGLIVSRATILILPYFLLGCIVVMFVCSEKNNIFFKGKVCLK